MLSILLFAIAAAAGQQTPEAVTPPSAEQPPAAGYSYDAEGRRDPFLSLVGRGNDPAPGVSAGAGLPGLLVNEVLVKGVLRGRSGYIAIVQSADSRTYIVRGGDRLFDGTVKTITQDGVIFSQDVHDPLSLVTQREVAKRVRAAEVRGSTGQPKGLK